MLVSYLSTSVKLIKLLVNLVKPRQLACQPGTMSNWADVQLKAIDENVSDKSKHIIVPYRIRSLHNANREGDRTIKRVNDLGKRKTVYLLQRTMSEMNVFT